MANEDEFRPLGADFIPQKRRDSWGVASLPLATFHLAFFFAYRNTALNNGSLVGLMLAAATCGSLAFAFAVTGIVLRRGWSFAGWTTLLLYATVAALMHR